MSDNNILDNFEKEIDEIKSMRENNSQTALEKLDLLHKKIQDELEFGMQSGNRSVIRSLMQAQQKIISEIPRESITAFLESGESKNSTEKCFVPELLETVESDVFLGENPDHIKVMVDGLTDNICLNKNNISHETIRESLRILCDNDNNDMSDLNNLYVKVINIFALQIDAIIPLKEFLGYFFGVPEAKKFKLIKKNGESLKIKKYALEYPDAELNEAINALRLKLYKIKDLHTVELHENTMEVLNATDGTSVDNCKTYGTLYEIKIIDENGEEKEINYEEKSQELLNSDTWKDLLKYSYDNNDVRKVNKLYFELIKDRYDYNLFLGGFANYFKNDGTYENILIENNNNVRPTDIEIIKKKLIAILGEIAFKLNFEEGFDGNMQDNNPTFGDQELKTATQIYIRDSWRSGKITSDTAHLLLDDVFRGTPLFIVEIFLKNIVEELEDKISDLVPLNVTDEDYLAINTAFNNYIEDIIDNNTFSGYSPQQINYDLSLQPDASSDEDENEDEDEEQQTGGKVKKKRKNTRKNKKRKNKTRKKHHVKKKKKKQRRRKKKRKTFKRRRK